MKKIVLSVALAASGCMMANEAQFSYFSYTGNDSTFDKKIDRERQYLNPILAGFYPDPSVCKKGDKFYLVNSTFSFFPGVPIFQSEDLVNWEQIGNVLDRPSQLDLEGLRVSSGIFAPAISYNPYNDTFYMITTLIDNGGNFFVKSKDPAKGWSDPIWLPVIEGIDPSFLFDNDGRAYIVHNSNVMGSHERYEGERAIRLVYFDVENDTTMGEPIEILRSGTHVRKNPEWIEGPHLYHIGDYYYLMCAEGGTGYDHSEVILRAERPEGPWVESPYNPILTQREGLDPNRPDAVSSTGHADIFEDNDGNWWAVFLGCRPYEDDLYNTGRETFMLPVEWKDGWPIILGKNLPVPIVVKKSNLKPTQNTLTGNFTYTDNFTDDNLAPQWIFLRNSIPDSYSISKNGLTLKALDKNITKPESVSAVFRRQQHQNFIAETELDFNPESETELAGMVIFQNEKYNFIFGKSLEDGKEILVLKKNDGDEKTIGKAPIVQTGKMKLKVEGNGKYYSFSYQPEGSEEWIALASDVDATNLSTSKAGGFIGTVIGLYATEAN